MEAEWATVCESIDNSKHPRIDLLAANSAGVEIWGRPLPTETSVTLALCLLGTRDEARAGGILKVTVAVLRPNAEVVGGTDLTWVFEEGPEPLQQGPPVRQIVPLTFAFIADVEGPHGLLIQVEGKPNLLLPYFVRVAEDDT